MFYKTDEYLQQIIKSNRPWTTTAILLRMANHYYEMQPAFIKLIQVIDEIPNPAEYLHKELRKIWGTLPRELRVLFQFAEHCIPKIFYNAMLRYVLNNMVFPYFLASGQEAYIKMVTRLEKEGAGTVMDFVGEEAKTAKDALEYQREYLYAMTRYAKHIAVKPSSLVPADIFSKGTFDDHKRTLKDALRKLFFVTAMTEKITITVDAEEYFRWCKLTEDAVMELLLSPDFCELENIGIALQTYRKDAMHSAMRIVDTAKKRGHPIRVRLVKGAYWKSEHEEAKKRDRVFPLFSKKENTDRMFELVLEYFKTHSKYVHVSVASHNAKSLGYAIDLMDENFMFDIEILNGMGESIHRALMAFDVQHSIYIPCVPSGKSQASGKNYLARRLEEVSDPNGCMMANM